MSWDQISWFFVFLSLAGNVFVIKKNVLGQWIWAFSNAGWIVYDIVIGNYSQAFLFLVYLGMCIWGIITWSRPEKPAETV